MKLRSVFVQAICSLLLIVNIHAASIQDGLGYLKGFFYETQNPTNVSLANGQFQALISTNSTDNQARVYAAFTEILNLMNDAQLNELLNQFGCTFGDLGGTNGWGFTGAFDFGAPLPNSAVDTIWARSQPMIDDAYNLLEAIPALWTNTVEVSTNYFPVDVTVYIDYADVVAAKAMLQTLRSSLNTARAYDLTLNYENLDWPVSLPTASISVDGNPADWSGIPAQLIGKEGDALKKVKGCRSGSTIYFLFEGAILSNASSYVIHGDMQVKTNGAKVSGTFCVSKSSWGGVVGLNSGFFAPSFSTNGIAAASNNYVELAVTIPNLTDAGKIDTVVLLIWQIGGTNTTLQFPKTAPANKLLPLAPDFMQSVRNPAALAMAKTDITLAFNLTETASTLIRNRADALLHFLEYNPTNAVAYDEFTNSLAKGKASLSSPQCFAFNNGRYDIPVQLGNLYVSPYITRAMLPAYAEETLFFTPFEAWLNDRTSGGIPDPTFGGVFPDLWTKNVIISQRPGTKLVDISYDVFSTKTNVVKVSLAVSNGMSMVNALTVSGAVGSGVTTGAAKTIIWNAGADWNGNLGALTFNIAGQDVQGAVGATPEGRVRIPVGENAGTDPDSGTYSITITNSFFMDVSEITKAQWDAVYTWAITNGYSFANAGSGSAANHPVDTINWYDVAKWCNARSQMEGFVPCYDTNTWSCNFNASGYRLPTSDEWQYAARGGLSGKRFPWGDAVTHSNDNYYSSALYAYDVSSTRGFHPLYGIDSAPETSGSVNGYGLYAMAGNVSEWCQDVSGSSRILAGGSWDQYASEARCAYKSWALPTTADYYIGFRTVQRSGSFTSAYIPSGLLVDTRDYLLIVSSAHGTPIPSIGTNLYAWRATVTGSVENAVTSGLTKWTSAGWGGSGSVPVSGGSTNTGGITLTGLVSSITWNWNTNYWLEVIKSGSGSVNQTNSWRSAGEDLSLSVTSSNGWLFMGWSGDASGDYTQENIIIPIVRPVSVTAIFSDDADGDGLLNTNETALGTDPRSRDSDGDGMDDSKELVAGTSPTNSTSVLAVQLSTGSSANQVSWYGVNGRYYQLEYTDNLANGWTPKGAIVSGANAHVMKLDITTGAKRFYRIRVSGSPSGF